MENNTDRIIPLDELDDFQVAEGDPDVRGWDVFASDGRKIGEVDDLLVDTAAMKVRYLDVDLEDDLLESDTERHVLIPIGYARLDQEDDQIFVDVLSSADLSGMPDYLHVPVTREYETQLRGHFDRGSSEQVIGEPPTTGTEFYADEAYDDGRFYSPRRGAAEIPRETPEAEPLAGEGEHVTGEVTLNEQVETYQVREEGDLGRDRGAIGREEDADTRDARLSDRDDDLNFREQQ